MDHARGMTKKTKRKTRNSVQVTHHFDFDDDDASQPRTQSWVRAQAQSENIYLPSVGRRCAKRLFDDDESSVTTSNTPRVQHVAPSDFDFDDKCLSDNRSDLSLGVAQDDWQSVSDLPSRNLFKLDVQDAAGDELETESSSYSESGSEVEGTKNNIERVSLLLLTC